MAGCGGGGRGAVGGAGLDVGGPFQPGRGATLGGSDLGALEEITGGAVFTMGNCGGVFLLVSHVPMSILCLPGMMGPGGMPGPFFFIPCVCTVTWGLAGWLAMLAQVAFFWAPDRASFESFDDFMSGKAIVQVG